MLGLSRFAAGGSARAADHVVFYPDWFAGPQFAGIYVALDTGIFAAAGLDVEVSPFAFGRKVMDLIDASPAVCGIGAIEGYIFLQQRSAGHRLLALAATLQESPAGFMALAPTRLVDARDFAGRRVGVHKFADPLFRWFVARAGLAPDATTLVFTDSDIARLTGGELDLMQGYATEEFVRLQHVAGDRARFLSFRALGFDSYSEILFTTESQFGQQGGILRRFTAAVRQGWERALKDPTAATSATRRQLPEGDDSRFLAASLEALQAYVAPDGGPPLAPMRREKWQRMQVIAVEMGLISRVEPAGVFLAPDEAVTSPASP